MIMMNDIGIKVAILTLGLSAVLPFYLKFKSVARERERSFQARTSFQHDDKVKRDVPISIHVFAWRRKKSLKRLLDSLLKAEYYDYDVPLFIHIDGDPLVSVVELAEDLYWPHGCKYVKIGLQRSGMPSAIVESWQPERGKESFGIFLEDDIAVSSAFFDWALFCLNFTHTHNDYYGKDNGLVGCSLYTPIVNEIGPAHNAWSPPKWNVSRVIGADKNVFFFQLPCSWGAMYSSEYWNIFLDYYWCRKFVDPQPELPGTRSNEWFKSWKRMFIELMLSKGWYLLYPSFPRSASFSTNFFELGVHSQPDQIELIYPDKIRLRGDHRFTVPLLEIIPEMKNIFDDIPCLNLQHELVSSIEDFNNSISTVKSILKDCL